MKLSWNTLDIFLKLPGNTRETSLKRSWNFLETPFKLGQMLSIVTTQTQPQHCCWTWHKNSFATTIMTTTNNLVERQQDLETLSPGVTISWWKTCPGRQYATGDTMPQRHYAPDDSMTWECWSNKIFSKKCWQKKLKEIILSLQVCFEMIFSKKISLFFFIMIWCSRAKCALPPSNEQKTFFPIISPPFISNQ